MWAYRFPITEISYEEMIWNTPLSNHKHYVLHGPDLSSQYSILINDITRRDTWPRDTVNGTQESATVYLWGAPATYTALWNTKKKLYANMTVGSANSILADVNSYFDFKWSAEATKIDTVMIKAEINGNAENNTISPEIDSISMMFTTKPVGDL
jgi:hypothetical protein